MKDWIPKKLIEKANTVSSIYKKIYRNGKTDELMLQLQETLEQERMVYNCIPFSEYDTYLDYFLLDKNIVENNNMVIGVMNLNLYFEPNFRIIQHLDYFREKNSMFCENYETEDENLRYQYMYSHEFFYSLMVHYMVYLKFQKQDDSMKLSFLNVLYSFPYVEELYLKMKEQINPNPLKILLKFSNIENIEKELAKEYSIDISEFYNFIFKNEEILKKANEFEKTIFLFYIGSLYFSIPNLDTMYDVLNAYNSFYYPYLSIFLREFLDDIYMSVQNSLGLRKNYKK